MKRLITIMISIFLISLFSQSAWARGHHRHHIDGVIIGLGAAILGGILLHDHHPPGHDYYPPEHDYYPPEHDYYPPEHDYYPPGYDHHPPGHDYDPEPDQIDLPPPEPECEYCDYEGQPGQWEKSRIYH